MTDPQIIQNLLNNRYSAALKGLYKVFPSVKKHILNNNGNTEDAQDIFQDALVILYKKVHAGEISAEKNIQAYLTTIVKNRWLEELRRRKKLPHGEMTGELASEEIEPETQYQAARTAYHLLGEKCRALLSLFYHSKKSYKEIASLLAFGDERVAKNQKYRCLQKAKENYQTLLQSNSHAK